MTEHPGRELGLGHLGLASYDPTERAWSFARADFKTSFISPIGKSTFLIAPRVASHLPNRADIRDETLAATHRAVDHALPREPNLVALEAVYRSDERISRSVSRALESNDPLTGDLMAFGALASPIPSHPNSRHNPSLLVWVDGPHRSSLRAVLLAPASYQVERDYEADLPENLSLRSLAQTGDGNQWFGPGISIQQISFSQFDAEASGASRRKAHGQNVLIAVRFPTCITILEPRVSPTSSNRRHPLSGQTLPPAHVGFNFVAKIDSPLAKDRFYADFSFNPWYSLQFAIIDSVGHAAIVELVWKKYQDAWISTVVHTFSPTPSRETDPTASPDGWARIVWVADPHTVAVCTRHELQLVDLQTQARLPTLRLFPAGSAIWILDVGRHPKHADQLFVLTSTELFWCRILSAIQAVREGSMAAGVHILATSRHFRDPLDTTLQMSIHSHGERLSLLIYSKLNDAVTTIHLEMSEDALGMPVMTSAGAKLTKEGTRSGASSVTLSCIVSAATLARAGAEPWEDSEGTDLGIECLQLFTLQDKCSVIQSHFCLSLDSDAHETCQKLSINPSPSFFVSPNSRYYGHISSEYITAEDEEDFIVPDQKEVTQFESLSLDSSHIPSASDIVPKNRPRYRFPQRAYIALEPGLVHTSKSTDPQPSDPGADFKSLTRMLTDNPLIGKIRGDTLHELAQDMSADEMDQEFAVLDGVSKRTITDQLHPETNMLLETRPLRSLYDILEFPHNTTSLTQIYQHLLTRYMTPLSTRAPSRYRVSLDRLVRQAAQELVLASVRIPTHGPTPQDFNLVLGEADGSSHFVEADQSRPDSVDIPGIPRMIPSEDPYPNVLSQMNSRFSQLLPSQAYPTPTVSQASVPPSPYSTVGSVSSTSLSNTAKGEAHLAYLPRYVTFTSPRSSTRSATLRVLRHWEMGADPNEYTYTETQAILDRARDSVEQAELSRGMSSRQRKKLAKRAQQQSGVARSQYTSSRASSIAPASQPLPVTGDLGINQGQSRPQVQDSSQTALPYPFVLSSQITTTASQRAPGKYGGRPPVKKRKKVEGFK